MPWMECDSMDERAKFIVRVLEGEKVAALLTGFDPNRVSAQIG